MRLSIKKLLVAVLVVIAFQPMSAVWSVTHDVHEGQIQVELKDSATNQSTTENTGTGQNSTGQAPNKASASSGKNGSLLKANESASYLLSFVGTMLFILGLSYLLKRYRGSRHE
ncbi:hypothetical protein [Enterococcus sp. BWR-S5]|uniref:hypothetical protein n=1 Tax=Enterococcus sp. BWR-S5 TaxID=2787714 RepID=UPI001923DD11|nr:hypothetical protein [Enterococcus sp. BWR-S5]MBL1224240.1 hypothetical protein [Enterococcus sp. BWR-S5]